MNKKRLKLAFKDIKEGVGHWRIWLMLGWQDIRIRYRRSQLGPFWITISMAVMIYSMGFLYGELFKVNLTTYYPFLAGGIITWTFISTVIIETNNAFIESTTYITQVKLPYTTYIMRVLTRNVIIFLHNILPIIPIMLIFHVHFGLLQFACALGGLLIIILCGLSYGTVMAILSTRFRDIAQIVISLIQVIFLLTPIMWQPAMLPAKYKFAANFNPFNQIIELVRAPLTGHLPGEFTVLFSLGVLVLGFILMLLLMCRSRHRISFWV